jgi:hypothetical protein
MVRFSPTFFPALLIDYCDLFLNYVYQQEQPRSAHSNTWTRTSQDDELGLEVSRVPDVFLYRNPDGHHMNEERGKEQQERWEKNDGRIETRPSRVPRYVSFLIFQFFFFTKCLFTIRTTAMMMNGRHHHRHTPERTPERTGSRSICVSSPRCVLFFHLLILYYRKLLAVARNNQYNMFFM